MASFFMVPCYGNPRAAAKCAVTESPGASIDPRTRSLDPGCSVQPRVITSAILGTALAVVGWQLLVN
jgi:hypothetical protein